jgi:hypothetical protein
MCCIVLKIYYLCDVIGDKPVKSYHKFLKYSKVSVLFSATPAGVKSKVKSIAMKKLFSEKNSFQPLSRQPSGKRPGRG